MQDPGGLIYIPAKGWPWAHQFGNDYLGGGNSGDGKMGTEYTSSEAVSQRISLSSDNSVASTKKQRPRKPGDRFCLNTEICRLGVVELARVWLFLATPQKSGNFGCKKS